MNDLPIVVISDGAGLVIEPIISQELNMFTTYSIIAWQLPESVIVRVRTEL